MRDEETHRSRWRNVRTAVALTVVASAAGLWGWLHAADHVDAPDVAADQAADIADVYSFRSPADPDRLVLAMTISNIQAAPEIELGRSIFDPNVLYQFKVDRDGDAVEDLVLQAFALGSPTDQVMVLRGPTPPEVTGTEARIVSGAPEVRVPVSTGADPAVAERNSVRFFAGVRDDPFFFDFARFSAILNGEESSFRDPGVDTFAGLNVYALVVEVPIDRLGGDASSLSVWGTTSR